MNKIMFGGFILIQYFIQSLYHWSFSSFEVLHFDIVMIISEEVKKQNNT